MAPQLVKQLCMNNALNKAGKDTKLLIMNSDGTQDIHVPHLCTVCLKQ